MRNKDKLLLVSVVLLLLYLVLSVLVPGLVSPFGVAYNWLLDVSLVLGYLGAFIISLVGNATILFPFPYVGVAFILGGLRNELTTTFLFDPWVIGVVAGTGAARVAVTDRADDLAHGSRHDDETSTGLRDCPRSSGHLPNRGWRDVPPSGIGWCNLRWHIRRHGAARTGEASRKPHGTFDRC